MSQTPLQYLLQTEKTVVQAGENVPPEMFPAGCRVAILYGGGLSYWPAWAAEKGAAHIQSVHLRELDVDALRTNQIDRFLFDFDRAETLLYPDFEVLAGELKRQFPQASLWLDPGSSLRSVPYYLDAWGFYGAIVATGEGFMAAGLAGDYPAFTGLPDMLNYPGQFAGWTLPQTWNLVQRRARAFRSLLASAGGKVFGGISTHLFTAFTWPADLMPDSLPQTAWPIYQFARMSRVEGTGSQQDVYKIHHGLPFEDDHEALLAQLAELS